MLRPMNDAEAISLAGDLAAMTDPADPMERRLCRLASHYRERALQAEDRIRYGLDLINDGMIDEAVFEMSRLLDGDPDFANTQSEA